MNTRQFDIGDTVTFKSRGVTSEGRIVGTELVDNPRRRCGQHFIIAAGHCWLDVHETAIVAIVG